MKYGDFLDLLRTRTSCRSFTDEEVNEEDIKKIIEAGLWAPSGHNSQKQRIIRIKNRELRECLRMKTSDIMTGRYDFDPFYGAKELFVVVCEGNDELAPYDGSLTMANMMLAATSLGLGSCWVNTAQKETESQNSIISKIAEELQISYGNVIGVGYLAIGHPKEVSKPKPRIKERYFEI